MSRSNWKIPFYTKNIRTKVILACRNTPLRYYLVDKLLKIHNGLNFTYLKVYYHMLNHYAGEFIFSKKSVYHPANKRNNIKKKKKN